MKRLHQGERLLLLANRSHLSKGEIAQMLNINPGHLSKLFKSELLTSKIRKGASVLFGVSESFFNDQSTLEELAFVKEDDVEYKAKEMEGLTAQNILKYIEEKDKRHYEERGRLLAIIENLTKK